MEPWFTFGVPLGAVALACGSYAYARWITAGFEKRYPLTEAGYPQQVPNTERQRSDVASGSAADSKPRVTVGTASERSLHMRVEPDMEVISADGQQIGQVEDRDAPDRLGLSKSGEEHHRFVPLAWIDHVDQRIVLNKTVAEMAGSDFARTPAK